MKSAISRAPITASTGLSDSAQIVRGGSNLTTVGAIPYVQSSGVLTQSAGLTFSDSANVRLATLAGGSSQSTNALLDITNSAGSSHWLTVLGDGKVGVGTNAPTQALTINGGNLLMSGAGSVLGAGAYKFGNGTQIVQNDPTTNSMAFYTGSGPIRNLVLLGTGPVGIGLANITPANATLSILDATASTGSTATWIGHDGSGTYSGVHLSALTTSLKVVAGLTQSTTKLQEWQNNAGTVLGYMGSTGILSAATSVQGRDAASNWSTVEANTIASHATTSSTIGALLSSGLDAGAGLYQASPYVVAWTSSATNAKAGADTSLSRISPGGIVGVGTGAAGTITGAAAMNTLGVGVTPTNTTNVSQIVVKAGSSQSTTNLQEWQNNAGTVLASVGSGGGATFTLGVTSQRWSQSGTVMDLFDHIVMGSGPAIKWASTAAWNGAAADTSLSRIGAGIVGFGTGAAGSVAGTIQATKYMGAGTAFITWGTGTPEAAVTATVGSMFLRTDGGAATTLYVKESGSGNTGWVAK